MINGKLCFVCKFADYIDDDYFITCSNCGYEYNILYAEPVEIKD